MQAIPKQFNQNSAILWEGPSQIDGRPIVMIGSGFKGSKNGKTGAKLIQTYILRADINPLEALQTGDDYSICGNCVHRHQYDDMTGAITATRTCYVNVGQGVLQVWKAYDNGRYYRIDITGAPFAGKMVRMGTYGDPAAVPVAVWRQVLAGTVGHTGYTHQWREPFAQELRGLVMASADTFADLALARSGGWRSFIVTPSDYTGKIKGAATCPASKESGYKLTCDKCLACNGANGRRGDIAIRLHGTMAGTKAERALKVRLAA